MFLIFNTSFTVYPLLHVVTVSSRVRCMLAPAGWRGMGDDGGVCLHIHYLMLGDREQNRKGKTKGLHREILKTGLLHKEFCVQRLWEALNYRDKGKNKRCLHRDA